MKNHLSFFLIVDFAQLNKIINILYIIELQFMRLRTQLLFTLCGETKYIAASLYIALCI